MPYNIPDCKFDIMNADELLSTVTVKNGEVHVHVHKKAILTPFWNSDCIYDTKDVAEFFADRVIPRGRSDVLDALVVLGLTEYDPWEIGKKTHLHLYEDSIWIKFEDENITWKNIQNEEYIHNYEKDSNER